MEKKWQNLIFSSLYFVRFFLITFVEVNIQIYLEMVKKIWNLRKGVMIIVVLAVTATFLGCVNKKGGDNSNSSSNESGGIKKPDITVNQGNVIFDNKYTTLTYSKVEYNELLRMVEISCMPDSKVNYEGDITIVAYKDPLVINGVKSEAYSTGYTLIGVGEDLTIFISYDNLQEMGIDVNEIRTIQATLTMQHQRKDDVFEKVVLFNVKLP